MTMPGWMRTAALGVATLAAAILSAAQSAPSYRIAGRVVSATTGEPVPRAVVAAMDEETRQIVQTAQSDGGGYFSLDRLPAAKYPLSASRRGFRTGFYDEHDEFNSAIVTGPGQDPTHLVFKLMPDALLRGVVTADGGDAVENASVTLFKHDRHEGRDDIREVAGTTTDDTGAYEFSGLQAGQYLLAVTASPWYAMHPPAASRNGDPSLDVAYPVTFYDSTTDEASAAPIAIEPGGRVEADVSLHAVPALRLQIAVPRKSTGEALARPELRQTIFGTQVSAESTGLLDAMRTGTTEFAGVAPGHYELVQGDPPRISEIDASSNESIDPNLGTPAVEVTGTLQSANGAPLPEDLTVLLTPAAGSHRPDMQANPVHGQFRFDNVPPGSWNLVILARQNNTVNLPVLSIASGGTVTSGSEITVKERPAAVQAVVAQSLTQVQGFAQHDGKGAAGVLMVLAPRQPSAYGALARFDQTDSDGSFSIHNVPAGQYTLMAIEDGWKLDRTDRNSIVRYLPGGIPVTVSARDGARRKLSDPVPVQNRRWQPGNPISWNRG